MHWSCLPNESCINRGCNYFLNGILEIEENLKQYLAFILTGVFLKKNICFYLGNLFTVFFYLLELKNIVFVKVAVTFRYRMAGKHLELEESSA